MKSTPLSVKKPELLIVVLGALSLLVGCLILCAKKYFLVDELISFYLVTDPSISHMLKALADQVDVSPPVYYVLAWLWVKVAGSSELSLRIFSTSGICLAFIIAWQVVRPSFGFWAGSIGVTASFFLSTTIFAHVGEARSYGLFLAVGALAFLQYDRIIRKGLTCSWPDFFCNAGIHASLVLTHNFGLLYSGVFLLSYVVSSIYKRVFAPKVYLSVVLGWAAFLPWLSSFLHQAEVGKPYSWIPVPGFRELLLSFSHSILIGVFVIMLFLASWLIGPREGKSESEAAGGEMGQGASSSLLPLLFLGGLLVVLPPIPVWIFSRVAVSIFFGKYMIISTLGWSVLLSWLTRQVLPYAEEPVPGETLRTIFLGNRQKKILSLLVCGLLLFPPSASLMTDAQSRPGAGEEQLWVELPIAVEAWDEYLARFRYSPSKDRYIHILDWEAALDRDSTLDAVDDYHSMAALKRNYPFFKIMQGADFLKQYDRFLVLDDKIHRWFELRIKNNPEFKITVLKDDLILVERKS